MIKLFKPFTSLWRLYKKTKSLDFAYHLLPWQPTGIIRQAVSYKSGSVSFKTGDRGYTKQVVSLFDKHGETLLKFLNASNIFFEKRDMDEPVARILINNQEVKIQAGNYENLKVIEEIFIDQLYDFHSKEKYVVLDVGMNVGAASLYFASFDNVAKVYSYEPFPDTYALAKKNILLSENIGGKVECFNYGLGASDQTLMVPKPSHGFLGGSTSAFVINELDGDFKKEQIAIEIRGICDQLTYVKNNHPDKKLILKLDCEGAEYEIIEVLKMNDMLGLADVYMIEYHFKGKKEILETLLNNGFMVMAPGSDEVSYYGMLYAIKK